MNLFLSLIIMDALPRDILGQIAAKPSLARPLSFTCRAICDAMRGLFTLSSKSLEIDEWDCREYHLSGVDFLETVIVSPETSSISVDTNAAPDYIDDRDEFKMCVRGDFAPVDPSRLIYIEHRGRLYASVNWPVLREFIGVLFNNIFTLHGYYNNFTGNGLVKHEDGAYYVTNDYSTYTRTNIKPTKLRGGYTWLKLVCSADFCTQ